MQYVHLFLCLSRFYLSDYLYDDNVNGAFFAKTDPRWQEGESMVREVSLINQGTVRIWLTSHLGSYESWAQGQHHLYIYGCRHLNLLLQRNGKHLHVLHEAPKQS